MSGPIFLSASVPDPDRDPKYYRTADLTAIRDAVRALATVVLPSARLVWGGHPSITPLISTIAQDIGITQPDRVRLFQSSYYRKMPEANAVFEKIVRIPAVRGNKDASLERMRLRMIKSESFQAGIFIGGMDGVETEFEIFSEIHSGIPRFPIASTGGAALVIFRRIRRSLSVRLAADLAEDLAYPTLFRKLLQLTCVDVLRE